MGNVNLWYFITNKQNVPCGNAVEQGWGVKARDQTITAFFGAVYYNNEYILWEMIQQGLLVLKHII